MNIIPKVCLTDFEEYAKQHLSKSIWDYYAAGADECCTRDDNLQAYKRYLIFFILILECVFANAHIKDYLLLKDHLIYLMVSK